MDFLFVFVVAGFAVGIIVGMTGVGGGSLMTPILLYLGISPMKAVGTDLLYAGITKSVGIIGHQKQNNINWRIAGFLALGSVPAALATLVLLQQFELNSPEVSHFIRMALGITIILTAAAMLGKERLLSWSHRNNAIFTRMNDTQRLRATVIVGVVMGFLVTITSIGAGVLGTVALFLIYPALPVARLVGTEIVHAIPLTLVAGLGHAGMGNVDWYLLINLLIGSLPGIYIGSHLPAAIPEKIMRKVLATMMVFAGLKLLEVF